MTHRIIVAFLILLLSVWFGLRFAEDPGYLLFTYNGYIVESPLWFALIVLLSIFIVCYTAIRLWIFSRHLISSIPAWLHHRRIEKAWYQTQQGLIALNEGHWRIAEKKLVKSASHSETPLLNYLGAARSAQEQGNMLRRDKYLRLAEKFKENSDIVVEITQAKLQMEEGQLEQALAGLKHLQQIAPNHPYVINLLHKLYVQLEDWQSLLELIPMLHRCRLLTASERELLEKDTHLNLFNQKVKIFDQKMLHDYWRSLPKFVKNDERMIQLYVQTLLRFKEHDLVEKTIRTYLRYYWSDALVELYGTIKSSDVVKQLKRAEGWLKNRKTATLYLALARLCMANHLWGKARSYYEEAIYLLPNPQAYAELGDLYNQLGEAALASQQYRQGLKLFIPKENSEDLKLPSVVF